MKNRLYSIEFLRVIIMLFIMTYHAILRCPGFMAMMRGVLHRSDNFGSLAFGVEIFFLIGGFFLYRRIASGGEVCESIKKIWWRLVPGLAFVFLIVVLLGLREFYRFPLLITLSGVGIGFTREVIGHGDWYINTYFWVSCLYIGLFSVSPKKGWLWLGILVYLTLVLKLNGQYPGWKKTYYTIIGSEFIRGIFSMGIGIVAGYLADRIVLLRKAAVRVSFTVFEIFSLVCVYNYLWKPNHAHFSYYEMELLVACFLISLSQSWGYISGWLNKQSWIQYASRYVYGSFLGQMVTMNLMEKYKNFGCNGIAGVVIVVGGGILIGIIEYHLIEKLLIPKLRDYFCEKTIFAKETGHEISDKKI